MPNQTHTFVISSPLKFFPACFFSLAFLMLIPSSGDLQAVTISEIMYSPRGEFQKRFEFIELYNENPDPLDLSGYAICDGISFVFPEGTWMEGYSFLVVDRKRVV